MDLKVTHTLLPYYLRRNLGVYNKMQNMPFASYSTARSKDKDEDENDYVNEDDNEDDDKDEDEEKDLGGNCALPRCGLNGDTCWH